MSRTKGTQSNAMVMLGRTALLVLTGLGLSGCIIFPTPSHGGERVITKEAIESFEPGTTTRADVLLRLGDPTKRLEEDRFFVYQWKRTHWYWGIFLGNGAGGRFQYSHYLGLEFTPDNRVKRVKEIDPWWFSPGDHYPQIKEWMAEERELLHP
jgi:outer membrane protein assembly factor BamE (lipoprotein component of BamABCDE complex)